MFKVFLMSSVLYSTHSYSCVFSFGRQEGREILQRLFDKYLNKIQDFKRHNCNELVPIAELNGVASLCKLFSALGTPANGVIISAWHIFIFVQFLPREVCKLSYHI